MQRVYTKKLRTYKSNNKQILTIKKMTKHNIKETIMLVEVGGKNVFEYKQNDNYKQKNMTIIKRKKK